MADEREQAIRLRAYTIWTQEGCPDGYHLHHWLQAEQDISGLELAAQYPKAVEGRKPAVPVLASDLDMAG